AEIAKPKRIQGVYVSDKEIKKIVKHLKTQSAKDKVKGEVKEELEAPPTELTKDLEKTLEEGGELDYLAGEEDPLYEDAKKLVFEARKASASLLQRRLRIGYARAAETKSISPRPKSFSAPAISKTVLEST
ncbi:unnamed protein product, partial [marine sediment metagenome]